MADPLEIELQKIIEALSGGSGITPPPGTEDQLKWYLDLIIHLLPKQTSGELQATPSIPTPTKTIYPGVTLSLNITTGDVAISYSSDKAQVVYATVDGTGGVNSNIAYLENNTPFTITIAQAGALTLDLHFTTNNGESHVLHCMIGANLDSNMLAIYQLI